MPRRRYKLFMVCAAVFCFMLYRTYLNSWIDYPETAKMHWPAAHPVGEKTGDDLAHAADKLPPVNKPPPIPEDDRWTDNQAKPATKGSAKLDDDSDSTGSKADSGTKTSDKTSGGAAQDPHKGSSDKEEDLSWKNPPKGASGSKSQLDDDPTKEHWKKLPEHFPIPEESLITLPTGTPKQLPKIQYDFKTEAADAKTKRETRLKRVKAEISRSWTGYKKFAWMHDELAPVSGKNRDPFCGWAATLVDSLDTLWIAGLKDEFDEAAKAVGEIDFTWTKRADIPVFETTIRYLGGLLAAYDVSGGPKGSYSILLDKAVELGEILMGVFDTPNRMPLLYYQWSPKYVSQPHRAGRVGIAELGTLSMEFTRLAQVTGKQKYYDAIDRITNALVEFQKANPTIPGLFPENLDATGCNHTATTLRDDLSKQAQEQVDEADLSKEPVGHTPGSGSKAGQDGALRISDDDRIHRRGVAESSEVKAPFTARGTSSEWDCVPQGLVPAGFGHQVFHVGGSQDSAYEYFPKQYILLGGLEPKYKKLHVDTIEAINEWLLYRPMTKDNDWDVLFPAKIGTNGHPKTDSTATYEVTHLTCFVGGMYGLGGKIFGREKDIEIAKKLTDGCVWAYQRTPSGLMPELSEVVPCPTLEKCEYNETTWHDALDTSREWRDQQVAKWEEEQKADASKSSANKVREDDDVPKAKAASKTKAAVSKAAKATPQPTLESRRLRKRAAVPVQGQKLGAAVEDEDDGSKLPTAPAQEVPEPAVPEPEKPVKPLKQGPTKEDEDDGSKLPTSQLEKPKPVVVPPVNDVQPLKQGPTVEDEDDGSKLPASLDEKVDPPAGAAPIKGAQTDTEFSGSKGSTTSNKTPSKAETAKHDHDHGDKPSSGSADKKIPSVPQWSNSGTPTKTQADSQKPISHEEYVEQKIKSGSLPHGVTSIANPSYILRPEAIESVWYMYRITGDPEWMEKGWKMFEATIQATRTEFANSAIDSVMVAEPTLQDHMESFWLAETLKYYFLLFAEPDVISLDEWVLNTEAHPFKRPA